ncbi:hypothetical protein Hanom_Chr15g01368411 [Helianthus anomalus]
MELTNMVAMISRSGRQLQRYNKGHRQVVGILWLLIEIVYVKNIAF